MIKQRPILRGKMAVASNQLTYIVKSDLPLDFAGDMTNPCIRLTQNLNLIEKRSRLSGKQNSTRIYSSSQNKFCICEDEEAN